MWIIVDNLSTVRGLARVKYEFVIQMPGIGFADAVHNFYGGVGLYKESCPPQFKNSIFTVKILRY